MCTVASYVAGCCGGRPAVGDGLAVGLGSLGNLHKFPHDSAEVPSSAVDEGGCSLGVGLHLFDQLVLLCMRGCPLGIGCL